MVGNFSPRFGLIATILLSGWMASCAGRAPSTREAAVAQSFKPSKGNALLYVYRPSSLIQAAQKKHVLVNGKSIGVTGSGSFLATELSPGTYTITAGGDPIDFSASSGRLYFIRQVPHAQDRGVLLVTPVMVPAAGFSWSSSMVQESVGRQEVAKCRQVATGTDF